MDALLGLSQCPSWAALLSLENQPMNTWQAIVLGMMVVWTPSLLLLAIFLWHAPKSNDDVDKNKG